MMGRMGRMKMGKVRGLCSADIWVLVLGLGWYSLFG